MYARRERTRACPSRRDAPLNLWLFTLPNDVSRTTFLPSASCQLSPALALRFRVVLVAVHEMASALARTILARRTSRSAQFPAQCSP